jgi:hypothetical protein
MVSAVSASKDEMLVKDVAAALNLSKSVILGHIRAKNLKASKRMVSYPDKSVNGVSLVYPTYFIKQSDFKTFKRNLARGAVNEVFTDGIKVPTAAKKYGLTQNEIRYGVTSGKIRKLGSQNLLIVKESDVKKYANEKNESYLPMKPLLNRLAKVGYDVNDGKIRYLQHKGSIRSKDGLSDNSSTSRIYFNINDALKVLRAKSSK